MPTPEQERTMTKGDAIIERNGVGGTVTRVHTMNAEPWFEAVISDDQQEATIDGPCKEYRWIQGPAFTGCMKA
jgi:hypothetical protein